jgi:hypothetical protein
VGEKDELLYLSPGGRIKRWCVGRTTKEVASHQEAILKTELLKGMPLKAHMDVSAFAEWGKQY